MGRRILCDPHLRKTAVDGCERFVWRSLRPPADDCGQRRQARGVEFTNCILGQVSISILFTRRREKCTSVMPLDIAAVANMEGQSTETPASLLRDYRFRHQVNFGKGSFGEGSQLVQGVNQQHACRARQSDIAGTDRGK